VSLGFAALENVLYVMQSGFETGIMRAFTSVPGHAIFGVFMGYFYGHAKLAEAQGRASEMREYLTLSLLVPLLLHGVYDFIAFSMEISELWVIPFFAFVALLYLIGLRRVNRSAMEDRRITASNARNTVADWYEQFRQL
jgi:RsiW-degrading membrane proteinase PrsW (M82 family)